MVMVTIFGVEFSLVAIIAAGAGILVAIGLFLLGCCYYCCCYRKKKRQAELLPVQNDKAALQQQQQLQIAYQQQQQQMAKQGSQGMRRGNSVSDAPSPYNDPAALAAKGGKPQLSPAASVSNNSSAAPAGSAVTQSPAANPSPVRKWEEQLQAMTFRKMSLEEVRTATGNFNKRNFLGEGAFAVVFRGVGPNGVPWAVKRSKRSLKEGSAGAQDFENEVLMISRLSHKNLVRLLGYCTEQEEHILIYEFCENGSLGAALALSRPMLSFNHRLDIAISTAEGLHYLHTAASPPIVHRDIKPDNILLDRNFIAKVADFGLLKHLLEGNQFESVYTRIAGTPGYLDPDYHLTSKITTKGDVYSFGVVLLELCTGQRAIIQVDSSLQTEEESKRRQEESSRGSPRMESSVSTFERKLSKSSKETENEAGPVHISMWVAPYVQAKVVEPIADPRFGNNYSKTALFRLLEIGLLCTTASSRKRPDMGAVVRWLHDVQDQLRLSEEEDNAEEEEEGHYSSVIGSARGAPSPVGNSYAIDVEGASLPSVRESSSKYSKGSR